MIGISDKRSCAVARLHAFDNTLCIISFHPKNEFIPGKVHHASDSTSKAHLFTNCCRYLPFRFVHCAPSCSVWGAEWWMNYSQYSWLSFQANKHLCRTAPAEPSVPTEHLGKPQPGGCGCSGPCPGPAAASGAPWGAEIVTGILSPVHQTLVVLETAEKGRGTQVGYESLKGEGGASYSLRARSFL